MFTKFAAVTSAAAVVAVTPVVAIAMGPVTASCALVAMLGTMFADGASKYDYCARTLCDIATPVTGRVA